MMQPITNSVVLMISHILYFMIYMHIVHLLNHYIYVRIIDNKTGLPAHTWLLHSFAEQLPLKKNREIDTQYLTINVDVCTIIL